MDENDDSSARPWKRQKPSDNSTPEEKTLDRISILPDSVLLHSLSFLPARYAIRTCVLSKRWQFLWTFLPVIDFSDSLVLKGEWNSPFVVSFISNTLILHQYPKLKKLRLHLKYQEQISSNVDVWLRFATRKNVEELELDFCSETLDLTSDSHEDDNSDDEDDATRFYAVPLNVLNNSCLVSLKLVSCHLKYGEHINWRSLKVLSLSKMSLSNDLIGEILCGSPLVEFLELRHCVDFDFLVIRSDRMRKLVIESCGNDSVPLKILAPNINSLKILGYLNTRKVLVTNSSSLVDVQLDFSVQNGGIGHDLEFAKDVRELLQNLRHVKHLTVGFLCLRVLPLLEMETLAFLPSKLECLRVCTYLDRKGQSGIVRLLSLFGRGCAPLTLVISIRSTCYTTSEDEPDDDMENYLTTLRKNFAASVERIKTVKVVNFSGLKREIEFILFILKNARRLEKMIIHTHPDPSTTFDLKKSFETAQRILSTPRCSENSVVMFS